MQSRLSFKAPGQHHRALVRHALTGIASRRWVYALPLVLWLGSTMPGWATVPEAFDDVQYQLRVTYDTASHTITGRVTMQTTWRGAAPLSSVYFFLPPNTLQRRDPREPAAFSDGRYPRGFEAASLTVQHVTTATHAPLHFVLQDDPSAPVGHVPDQALLHVTLPRPYAPGERLALTIVFTTHVPQAKNWGHYHGIVALDGLWYPLLVPYRQNTWLWGLQAFIQARYSLTLTTDINQQVVSSLPWTQRTTQHELQTLVGTSSLPLYRLGLSLSRHWHQSADTAHTPPLMVFSPADDASQADHLLQTMSTVLAFYQRRFALTLAAPQLTVVIHERDASWPYSAAANHLIFLSRDLVRVPSLVRKFVEYQLARNLAGQWWGLRTVYNVNTERWIGEGLTTYMALEWLDDTYGRGRTFLTWQGTWLPNFSYREQSVELAYRRLAVAQDDQLMTAPLATTPSRQDLRTIYQKKGALVYRMLHDQLGDATFQAFLQRLMEAGPVVTTDDVQRVAEAVSSQDLTWFFRQWVHERAQLDYAIDAVESTPHTTVTGQTVYMNRVHIRRLGDAMMPVMVRLIGSDGSHHDLVIPGTAAAEVVTWEHTAPVSDVQLDPERRLPDIQRLNNTAHIAYTVRPLIDFPRLDRYLIYPFVVLDSNFIDGYIPRLQLTALYLDDQAIALSVGYKETPQEISLEGDIILNRFPLQHMSTSLSFRDRESARTLTLATSLGLEESRLQQRLLANQFTLGYRVTFLEELNDYNNEPVPDAFAPDTGRLHSVVFSYQRDTRIPSVVGAPLQVFTDSLAYGYALRLDVEIASELLGSNRPDFQQVQWEVNMYPRLWNQTWLLLRLFGGWSAGTIPLQRKLSLAGIDTVRGYDYSLRFLGDRMLGGTVGLRVPILRDLRLEDPWRFFGLRGVHLGPFVDAGWVWNTDEQFADVSPRASAGLRLIAELAFGSLLRFEVAIDVAHPIDKRGRDEDGVQTWVRLQSTARGGLH